MLDPQVPWTRIASFVRQHTHDVRNDLNSLDLEAALLQQVVPAGEAKEGVDRIRKQVKSLAQKMRSLSAQFQDGQIIAGAMPAKSLLSIWHDRHAAFPNAPEIRWSDQLGTEEIRVDVEMMATVIQELLSNSATFPSTGPIEISATADKCFVTFEMREPKSSPLDTRAWGQPFFSTRRGSHGLGLWTARRLVEANHGTFAQRYLADEGILLTQIVLPKAS